MVERNLCQDAGCSASCCHDMWLRVRKDLMDFFPEAEEIPYTDLHERLDDGTYFARSAGVYWVRIVGRCENLQENNECAIYGNQPSDCKNLQIASDECVKARRRDSLLMPLDEMGNQPFWQL